MEISKPFPNPLNLLLNIYQHTLFWAYTNVSVTEKIEKYRG